MEWKKKMLPFTHEATTIYADAEQMNSKPLENGLMGGERNKMPNDKEMNGTRALAHADVRSPTVWD